MQQESDFDRAVAQLDQAVEACAPDIWIGAEPTFTDRALLTGEWLNQALGPTKEARAASLLARMPDLVGTLVLRSLGRQYADEEVPRWNFGLYRQRSGAPVWSGPADPLTAIATDHGDTAVPDLAQFQNVLRTGLVNLGWPALALLSADQDSLPRRILFAPSGQRLAVDQTDERLHAGSLHARKTPPDGLSDSLAQAGMLLLKLGVQPQPVGQASGSAACLELPPFPDVDTFLAFVEAVEQAARQAGLQRLIWLGHPPPVDQRVAWTSITPDPAVIEINTAPATDTGAFLADMRGLFSAADAEGLAPERYQYNGQVGDSGGGGQFTLGGPQPLGSPFIRHPQTLPRLIRYLLAHPSLSYWFAPDYVGSSSQSPRPDEGVRDNFVELDLALRDLARCDDPTPEFIWRSLNNFLVDPSGNSHRSELNIEKLWNPYLPHRGCLGLIEFRAFRMSRSPEKAAAIAALLRALVAMLIVEDKVPDLTDWADELHTRFALPFYLRADLAAVLDDLAASGLEPGAALRRQLLDNPDRELARVRLDDCELRLEQALEFWPLLGDTAMQASGDSRLVDASTQRLQVSLRSQGTAGPLEDWALWVNGVHLPWLCERDADGEVRLFGLRYRSFDPVQGLHPGVAARTPVCFTLWNARMQTGTAFSWHEWLPQGGAYDGLPDDPVEARARRQQRLVAKPIEQLPVPPRQAPPGALGRYCFDLRYL